MLKRVPAYHIAIRAIALAAFTVMALPLFAALAHLDDCCGDQPDCCAWANCQCGCHFAAGPVIAPAVAEFHIESSPLELTFAAIAPEEHPTGTDRPPRFAA